MQHEGDKTTAVPSRGLPSNYHHVQVSILGEGEAGLHVVEGILANEDTTFADINWNSLIDAGIPEVTVLQSHYGPKPFWTEPDPDSTIGACCQTLYAVRGEGVRYILALVRSSEAHYPVVIFDFQQDPLEVAFPSTKDKEASITRYSIEDLTYKYDSYDSLKSQEAGTFPTCFVITVGQIYRRFQFDMPAEAIPPFLLVPFCSCKALLKRAYSLRSYPQQTIHTTGALLHAIIALAAVSNKSEPVSESGTGDTMLRIDLLLANNLQKIINVLEKILDSIETEAPGTSDDISKTMDNCFMKLCGEYPGAVTIRNSYANLEKLKAIDQGTSQSLVASDTGIRLNISGEPDRNDERRANTGSHLRP